MTSTLLRRRTSVAALTLAALLLAGCGNGEEDQNHQHPLDAGGPTAVSSAPAPPTLPEPFTGLDQNDAEQVMVAAATTLFSYTPAEDANQLDAAERAAPLFDERYYAENSASFIALAPVTGTQWSTWAQRGAVVSANAAISRDDHPADQPGRISRVVAVTQTTTAADGTPLGQNTFAAYLTATKLGVWRIAAVAVR